ncbi:ArsA family ATPase [Clostridium sp. D2Q-11]|uniref:ArsA family ATPase n=1 Tax=Anaeromonas frigoriresistens TaxID=2683708 RepID=A0A942UXX2_9FIRM|nr:ArsA family ATPase [Anaeromonas frigoriresistens]MBS4540150.1 ArsA family ATPase [Anaeromonas frigoriresistens]
MNKIIFFGGKGGVGKTTCSYAQAHKFSKLGFRTLLISTDPAHSISDLVSVKIGPKIVNIKDDLDCLEIDSNYESKKYIQAIKKNLGNILSPIILEEINRQLDIAYISPGTQEAALFDKMIEIIIDKNGEYDRIVFDTAPTGHTLRLMSLPELLSSWINSLINNRKKALKIRQMVREDERGNKNIIENDPIIQTLIKRREKILKAREILINKNMLEFIFVLNPEKLAIEETKKALSILQRNKIKTNKIIVNRVLPNIIMDDFWREKKIIEERYLTEIGQVFKKYKIIKIPLQKIDMNSENIDILVDYFI